jgi:hypothetical protein
MWVSTSSPLRADKQHVFHINFSLHSDDHEGEIIVEHAIAEGRHFAPEGFEHLGRVQSQVFVPNASNIVLAELYAAGVASFGQAVGVKHEAIAGLELQLDVFVRMLGEKAERRTTILE